MIDPPGSLIIAVLHGDVIQLLEGDIGLELTSRISIEVLAYVRTPGGFLTSMHGVVEGAGRQYDVAIFNPGDGPARVTIGGIDDSARSSGDVIRLTVPAGAAVTVTAKQLEDGDFAFHDGRCAGLGDGQGKWRLHIDSEEAILLVNVLASPTGRLTNLSTNPTRISQPWSAQHRRQV